MNKKRREEDEKKDWYGWDGRGVVRIRIKVGERYLRLEKKKYNRKLVDK